MDCVNSSDAIILTHRPATIFRRCKGALKMAHMKMTDQLAGHEIAARENARHDKYLFIVVSTNHSNFSSIVENSM